MPQFRLSHLILLIILVNVTVWAYLQRREANRVSKESEDLKARLLILEEQNSRIQYDMSMVREKMLGTQPVTIRDQCPDCAAEFVNEVEIGMSVPGIAERVRLTCSECDAVWKTEIVLAISARTRPIWSRKRGNWSTWWQKESREGRKE
jgi:hypothetical protein